MISALLLTACLTTGQIQASSDDIQQLRGQVRALVRRLDSDQLATRNEAEAQLIKLGPTILDLLEEHSDRGSAEVRQRLDRVGTRLQQLAAEAAGRASLVRLQGQMKLSEALSELSKQTENQITDFRGRFGQQQTDPQLSLDFANVPFWQALDQILDQAGMTVYNYSGQLRTLAIVSRDEAALPRTARGSTSGLFRVEGSQIEALRDLRNPASRSLKLTLEILWEPRVVPILIQQPLQELQIVGSDGTPIRVAGQEGRLEVNVQDTVSCVELILPLELPERRVEKIATLKGRFTSLVPGRVATFEFDNLPTAKNVTQKKAGVTVTLQEVRKNGDIHELRVRVGFQDAAGSLQSHLDWVSSNEAYFVSPDGQHIGDLNFERFLQRENEVGFAYLAALDGDLADYTFVYKTPAAILQLSVPYELKDIVLP